MDLSDRGEGDGQEGQIPTSAAVGPAQAVGGVDPGAGILPGSNDAMVRAIMGMGINRDDALLAIQQTGAASVEAAISWVFEFENRENQSEARQEGAGVASPWEEGIYQEYKMVFVVNGSLPMSLGKTASQVGHAAIDLYQNLVSGQQDVPLLQWNENGSKKIALRSESTEEILQLAVKADEAGLPNSCIRDAGLTQIPGGSVTVLGIFGASSNVDKVTGHLKLL